MGIETVAAIAAPIVIGAISKAMSDSNQRDVDAAQAKKNAVMGQEADKLNKYRGDINQSINNGMRQQSTAYQGAGNMLATMGLGGKAPSGLNYNPMGNIFPQNQIPAGAPTSKPLGAGGAPGATPAPTVPPVPAPMSQPTPEAAAHAQKPIIDSMKIRAALGDYRPGNIAPTLGPQSPPSPKPVTGGPLPDPYAAALGGKI